jgi:hypothetical protein
LKSATREVARQEEGWAGEDRGKINGNYLRLIPGLHLEDRMN